VSMAESHPPMLENMSWTEVRDLLSLRPVGLLPVGAIEAHGPHLPLNTDIIIAKATARRGAMMLRRAGLPSIVLPSISYTVSYVGDCFPGTIPVPSSSLSIYLEAVLESLIQQGFRALCLCNAHLEPGHVETLREVVDKISQSATIPIGFPDQRTPDWAQHLGDEFQRGARHAGQYETSIVMAEEPESVRRIALEELRPVWIDLPKALQSGARDFAEAGAELGYFGDPAAATPEHGELLLDQLGRMIMETVASALANSR
jgi:creatinine amidohydrolase